MTKSTWAENIIATAYILISLAVLFTAMTLVKACIISQNDCIKYCTFHLTKDDGREDCLNACTHN